MRRARVDAITPLLAHPAPADWQEALKPRSHCPGDRQGDPHRSLGPRGQSSTGSRPHAAVRRIAHGPAGGNEDSFREGVGGPEDAGGEPGVLNSSSWNFFDAELLGWRVEIGLDEEFRRSLLEIRLAVEPAASGLAAERRSEVQVAQMRDCVRRMGESSGDRDKFAEADLEFHQLIGVASGNPMMRSLAAVIEAALFASFSQNSPVGDARDLKETAASHGAVVDAIAFGSAPLANSAMVNVISLGQRRIARMLRSRKAGRARYRKT